MVEIYDMLANTQVFCLGKVTLLRRSRIQENPIPFENDFQMAALALGSPNSSTLTCICRSARTILGTRTT